MTTGTTELVSILAGNYMQPLGLLIERLVAKQREGLPGIKANEHETDWAISSILIAVVMFEGWLMRVRYDLGANAPNEHQALAFYTALQQRYLLPDVTEAFVMRDIVAHNHLWGTTFAWNETGHQHIGSSFKIGGDKKFRQVVDLNTGLFLKECIWKLVRLVKKANGILL